MPAGWRGARPTSRRWRSGAARAWAIPARGRTGTGPRPRWAATPGLSARPPPRVLPPCRRHPIPLRGRARTARRDRPDQRCRQRHGHGYAGADQRQRERPPRRRGRRAFTPLVDEPPITLPPLDPTLDPPSTEPLDGDDEIPLATRVPGQHMSHQPSAGPEVADPEADPLRPYRVHDCSPVTPRANGAGVRSRTAARPAAPGGPAGTPMDGSTNPWPGNGPGREDGR